MLPLAAVQCAVMELVVQNWQRSLQALQFNCNLGRTSTHIGEDAVLVHHHCAASCRRVRCLSVVAVIVAVVLHHVHGSGRGRLGCWLLGSRRGLVRGDVRRCLRSRALTHIGWLQSCWLGHA